MVSSTDEPATASCRPSALSATVQGACERSSTLNWGVGTSTAPVVRSQTFAEPSQPAVTNRRPSGVNATLKTWPVWPRNVATSWPLVRSQTSAVLSAPGAARRPPSGLNASATGTLGLMDAGRVQRRALVVVFQTLTFFF